VKQLLPPHCRISLRTLSAQFHDCEGFVGDTDSFPNLQYAVKVFELFFLHDSELSTFTLTNHHHSSVPAGIP
jgi:hypothetical protein